LKIYLFFIQVMNDFHFYIPIIANPQGKVKQTDVLTGRGPMPLGSTNRKKVKGLRLEAKGKRKKK